MPALIALVAGPIGRRDRPERRRRSTPCGRCTAWGRWTARTPDATAAAVAALKHPSAGVRRNAVQVLPRDDDDRRARSSRRARWRTTTPRSAWRRCWRWRRCRRSQAAAEALVAALAAGDARGGPLAARRGHQRRRGARPGVPPGPRRPPLRPAGRRHDPRRRRSASPSTTPAAGRPIRSAALLVALAGRRPARGRRRSSPGWPAAGPRTGRRRSTPRPRRRWSGCCPGSPRRPRGSSSAWPTAGAARPWRSTPPRSPRRSWRRPRTRRSPTRPGSPPPGS